MKKFDIAPPSALKAELKLTDISLPQEKKEIAASSLSSINFERTPGAAARVLVRVS